MIDFYFWTTPNGYKVLMFLEETGIKHRVIPVNISKGEQFKPDFLKISPNNKIPAIVDRKPKGENGSIELFESGAILLYLAEKTGLFLPQNLSARADVLQWLFWQVGGVGPMFGQNLHFGQYAGQKIPYAIERYGKETSRLLNVLDKNLTEREYIAGEFSIADMATYPWVFKYPSLQQDLDAFPNVRRWFEQVASRPATISAYERGKEINTTPTFTKESRKYLLGQSASTCTELDQRDRLKRARAREVA